MSDKKTKEEIVNCAAEELSWLFVAHIDESHLAAKSNKPEIVLKVYTKK